MAKSRWEIENQGFNEAKEAVMASNISVITMQQSADHLAAGLLGFDHRTTLPSALSPPGVRIPGAAAQSWFSLSGSIFFVPALPIPVEAV